MKIQEETKAPPLRSLRYRRDSAERLLNGVRAGVLALLAIGAMIYAPELPPALNLTNLLVVAPALAWTVAQYAIWYRARSLPDWLAIVNPVVDVTALTIVIAGYGLAQSATLALRSPIFLMYFVILAARPVASSVRKAAFVAALIVAEYGVVLLLLARRSVEFDLSPVSAALSGKISPLDEGAKVLLLVVAGVVAIYATSWAERLVIESTREAEARNRVATRLVQAELDTLKLQLNPHFLFNALNSALALIATDPPVAEKMISGLSEFLRMVLTSSSEQEVALERELALVDRYVEIQKVRFGDHLQVNVEAAPETRHALVPSLLLQPLVENAIRHGISSRALGGSIELNARRQGDDLHLEVVDDGVGSAARRTRQRSRGMGLGLVNTATRLVHLYGSEHSFSYGDRKEGGFRVEIVIPFRAARLAGSYPNPTLPVQPRR